MQTPTLTHRLNKEEKRFASRLKRGPTKKDGPGYIYVYHLGNHDQLAHADNRYYKIGRTEKQVGELFA